MVPMRVDRWLEGGNSPFSDLRTQQQYQPPPGNHKLAAANDGNDKSALNCNRPIDVAETKAATLYTSHSLNLSLKQAAVPAAKYSSVHSHSPERDDWVCQSLAGGSFSTGHSEMAPTTPATHQGRDERPGSAGRGRKSSGRKRRWSTKQLEQKQEEEEEAVEETGETAATTAENKVAQPRAITANKTKANVKGWHPPPTLAPITATSRGVKAILRAAIGRGKSSNNRGSGHPTTGHSRDSQAQTEQPTKSTAVAAGFGGQTQGSGAHGRQTCSSRQAALPRQFGMHLGISLGSPQKKESCSLSGAAQLQGIANAAVCVASVAAKSKKRAARKLTLLDFRSNNNAAASAAANNAVATAKATAAAVSKAAASGVQEQDFDTTTTEMTQSQERAAGVGLLEEELSPHQALVEQPMIQMRRRLAV